VTHLFRANVQYTGQIGGAGPNSSRQMMDVDIHVQASGSTALASQQPHLGSETALAAMADSMAGAFIPGMSNTQNKLRRLRIQAVLPSSAQVIVCSVWDNLVC
jgi:hypothetical protein